MPDGKTHFAVGVMGAATAVGLAFSLPPPWPGAVAVGSLLGLVITPDMDIDAATYTEWLLSRVPLAGWLFQVVFYGYGLLFRHRGLSHHWLIGTASRMTYTAAAVMVMAVFVVGIAALRAGVAQDLVTPAAVWLVRSAHPGLLLGWWLQDLLHVVLDAL